MGNPTIRELHEQLLKKEITALELTKKCLKKIQETNEEFHSFLFVSEKLALQQAKEADKIIEQGDATMVTGIPFAVKDNFCVKGTPTTASSKILQNYIAPYTATSVQKLFDAGAVLLGKTNLDEFAMGSSTENSAFGITKNAHDSQRVPGGSSGGSATAVALGQCVFALGSDTAGSIRQPAAFSGIVGLKPTYGRVSRYGVIALGSSLDVIGPLTNTVEDAAIVLEVIAGHDPLDSTTSKENIPQVKNCTVKKITGLKIGVPKEYFINDGINSEVQASVQKAIQEFADNGAIIKEVSLPHTKFAVPAYYIILPSEASSNLARYDGIRYGHSSSKADDILSVYKKSRHEGFGDEPKRRIMLGTFALSAGYHDAYYKQAQKVRTLIREDFVKVFQSVDILITPTSPSVAFEIGKNAKDPLAMYLEDIFTAPLNLSGMCGISVPTADVVQVGDKKLPIGLQIIGPDWSEQRILRCADFFANLHK